MFFISAYEKYDPILYQGDRSYKSVKDWINRYWLFKMCIPSIYKVSLILCGEKAKCLSSLFTFGFTTVKSPICRKNKIRHSMFFLSVKRAKYSLNSQGSSSYELNLRPKYCVPDIPMLSWWRCDTSNCQTASISPDSPIPKIMT